MKKNLVLKAAVLGTLLALSAGAQAGAIGTTTQNYATEIFGSAANPLIKPLGINYQFGVPVAANQTMYVYVTLSGGATFNAAPVAADLKITDSSGVPVAATASALVGGAAPQATAVFTYLSDAVGLNTNSVANYNASAAIINGLVPTLGAVGGGSVSATVTIASSLSTVAVPTTGIIDAAGTHAGVILTSSPAITGQVVASSAFPLATLGVAETARINVAAPQNTFTTPGALLSNVNTTTAVNLGAVRFANNPGQQLDTAGAEYLISSKYVAAAMTGVVTGAFDAVAATRVTLDATANCATAPAAQGAANSATVTATTATFIASQTPGFASADGAGTNVYICYIPSATAVAIPATIPTATFTITPTAGATIEQPKTATGSLYDLHLNGVIREVRSYIPAAATGYQSYIRVINSTGPAATVTGQFVYADGTTSTPAVLIAGLPSGGSQTLTATQVEAALGAPVGGAAVRPRLRLTAPVVDANHSFSSIEAQSFMSSPAGVFTDMTGAQ